MITRKHKFLIWFFAALTAGASLIAYPFLPDRIPVNWGLNGQITYGEKFYILLFGGLALLIAPTFIHLPKIDPKKKNYARFAKYYGDFGVFLMIFLLLSSMIILSESFWPGHISVSKVVPLMAGGMLIFIGNRMPKFKSNFFIGIRTPWTISNTNVWNKTHRLGGALSFWGGVLFCLCCLWLPEAACVAVLIAIVLVSGAVPVVMSYVWFRQEQAKEKEDE